MSNNKNNSEHESANYLFEVENVDIKDISKPLITFSNGVWVDLRL